MSPPEVVTLDTRGADTKAAFLTAAGACLRFPAYSAANWDAFEESLRDFVRDRSPVLVVWTGASDLPAADRDTVLAIMGDAFTDGADLLIVDDVTAAPQPDFALDRVVMAIPAAGANAAGRYWTQVVGLTEQSPFTFTGDALLLEVVEDPDFQPSASAGPTIMARDLAALEGRIRDAGLSLVDVPNAPTRTVDSEDPFGNRVRFTAY